MARVLTNNFQATICRDGETVNYHGLNLNDGLSIRTPATEHGAGWTGRGEDGITYEVSNEVFEVRQGEELLASEGVVSFIDPTHLGAYRPFDLLIEEPVSYPACDGAAIVVVDTFADGHDLMRRVEESLEAHPGAGYLATDGSCDSLVRPTHEAGTIYLTFYWAGHDETEICDLIESTGTHGFWLHDDVAPGEQVDCG